MAKSPAIKFPRISAGFYGITMDGEFVGYVMKDIDLDSKETNWYVFDDNTQGKDIANLNLKNSIDGPDSLLREAKESAKTYFLNRPEKVETASNVVQLNEAEWDEPKVNWIDGEEPEDIFDDIHEDNTLFVSDDGEFEAFEDELEIEDEDSEVLSELALV